MGYAAAIAWVLFAMLFAFTILQWSQRTRWVPTDYKSVAELKSRYSDLRGQHKTLVAKLKKAGNTDPTQNPYAVRDDSQDGGYGYDQNARAADQLALQDLEADMREVYMQIEEAREASGGIQRNVRRVANEVFQGTINSVPKGMRGAVKQSGRTLQERSRSCRCCARTVAVPVRSLRACRAKRAIRNPRTTIRTLACPKSLVGFCNATTRRVRVRASWLMSSRKVVADADTPRKAQG